MVSRSGQNLSTSPGFAVGIVMTTRPFPYLRKLVPEPVGLPILFDGDITERDRRNIHFGEIGLEGSQLVTAGYQGWTMVVTGTGLTVAEAQTNAYQLAQRVVVPNVRYRNDIGAKLIAGDFAKIEGMYLLGD
jgi:phosphoribosylamine--glycine ligase